MGINKDIPKYPVLFENPTFKQVTRNFKSSEYNIIAVSTLLSAPFGYLAGTSRLPQMRMPSMYMATVTGLVGGFLLAFQQSGGRLMGRLPNDDEVREFQRS